MLHKLLHFKFILSLNDANELIFLFTTYKHVKIKPLLKRCLKLILVVPITFNFVEMGDFHSRLYHIMHAYTHTITLYVRGASTAEVKIPLPMRHGKMKSTYPLHTRIPTHLIKPPAYRSRPNFVHLPFKCCAHWWLQKSTNITTNIKAYIVPLIEI